VCGTGHASLAAAQGRGTGHATHGVAGAAALAGGAARLPKGKLPVAACIAKMLEHSDSPAKVNYLLDEYECMVERELETPKMFTKMGPMLGLMGTLIPMGPALVGLSSGDIASMAYNMQVAFATTVIGLFAGGIGFVVKSVRQRWYRRDMGALSYIADMLDENRSK